MKTLLIALIAALFSTGVAHACGPDTDCTIGDRIYRIALPDEHDGTTPIGAIVHAHGYRGTASGVVKNKGLRRMASRLGVALIAPKSKGDDWVIPGAPRKRGVDGSVEFEYFDALIADAASRFPIDTNRMMVSGFSAGGMMVWNLACHRSEMFAGYVPVAGTFWTEPEPRRCAPPALNLLHIHGTSDNVVPIDGRRIADTKQGSVTTVLAQFVKDGGFGSATRSESGKLSCERRTNAAGNILEFCTHPGGHSLQSKWLERAWRELEASGAL